MRTLSLNALLTIQFIHCLLRRNSHKTKTR